MPVLSAFISYRPGRTKPKPVKSVNSPFTIRQFDSPGSPHPYASPSSRVLDINDNSARVPDRNYLDESNSDYYRPRRVNGPTQSPSPQVELNLDIGREPLTNWLGSLLESDSSLQSGAVEASGSRTPYQYGHDATTSSRVDGISGSQMSSSSEDDDEGEVDGEMDLSSVEGVLAGLEAMDASNFGKLTGSEESNGNPALTYSKRAAPSPIKIPSLSSHGPKVQLLRSADPSRPTSQVSSPESSAISGTTLARALMSNTFALSGDSRKSQYRSGTSNLTRSDSATLPRGEFAMLHSPYWRERTYSGGEQTLSPGSAPSEPVPPIPGNAELVYVPPKTTRQGSDPKEKRRNSSTGSFRSEPLSALSDPATTARTDSGDLNLKVHPISPITEDPTSLPNTPQPRTEINIENVEETTPILASSNDAGPTEVPPPKRESENYSEGLLSPGRSSMSDAPSSARDIDGVLDYYSLPETPDVTQDRNFRPAFSPISEESASQLSPPNSLRAKVFVSPIVSPASPNGRVGFGLSRRTSETRVPAGARPSKQPLLPIGERPRSQISVAPSSYHNSSASSSSPNITSENNGHLLPPTVFFRERAGMTPSPIKVIRDSRDLTTYKITVTPLQDNSVGSTPTTGDSDLVQQEFPETPSAFSPLFSANGAPSPGMRQGHVSDFISMAVPQTPMSALLPGTIQPSIAQQVLLTRAATSVRHSRQGSLGRARLTAHPYPRPPSIHDNAQENSGSTTNEPAPVIGETLEDQHEADQHDPQIPPTAAGNLPSVALGGTVTTTEGSSTAVDPSKITITPSPPPSPPSPPPIQPSSTQESTPPIYPNHLPKPQSLASDSSHSLGGATLLAPNDMTPGSDQLQSASHSRPASRAGSINLLPEPSHTEASNFRPAMQQRIPPSPRIPPPAPPLFDAEQVPPPTSSETSRIHHPIEIAPHQTVANQTPPPAILRSESTLSRISSTSTTVRAIISPSPPTQLLSTPSLYSLYDPAPHGALGSPPPYCPVAPSGHSTTEALTPSTGGSYDPHFRFGVPYHPPSPSLNAREPSGSRLPHNRTRSRPPLPAGPRRPSQQQGVAMVAGMRERGGSFSSVASGIPTGRRPNLASLPSPKFQTPEPKWRGYTMEAAKWTFTSAQLQAIVSRAIRQSSEATSIRLLPLDIIDEKIPGELETLETRRTEVKTKYRALSRRRGHLLEVLASSADSLDHCTPAHISRLVDDLKDISASLDRWAEELHSVDEQIAQLSQLSQAHFGSALAMALRKMNASFLKQFAESQSLRQQMQSLEAERDKAWRHAEELANEFDELRTGKTTSSSSSAENRYSRISAVRKSSIRASKAGLYSGSNRFSQRSSVSSNNRIGMGQTSSTRTTFSLDGVPPVPPIPRQRPVDIVTDIPLRSSLAASTSGVTPTSETRAMVRAQEELYEMLGISADGQRLRRSRSVTGVPGNPDHSQHPNSPTPHTPYDVLHTGRRASLPGSPVPQPSHYNALTANVSIMLSADREGWI